MEAKGIAYAKLSLSLAILGKRDNLHELDMITIPFTNYKDSVQFIPLDTQKVEIEVRSSLEDFDKNRFESFAKTKIEDIASFFGVNGKFVIEKGVPLGKGIGGSASFIAAAIKAIEKCSNKKMNYSEMVKLGSDVPCVYLGKPCRVQGIGDKISEIENYDFEYKVHILNSSVDTAKAYEVYDSTIVQKLDVPTTIKEALINRRNDLEYSAVLLNNEVKEKLSFLRKNGDAIVSGCGSTIIELL